LDEERSTQDAEGRNDIGTEVSGRRVLAKEGGRDERGREDTQGFAWYSSLRPFLLVSVSNWI